MFSFFKFIKVLQRQSVRVIAVLVNQGGAGVGVLEGVVEVSAPEMDPISKLHLNVNSN